MGAYCDTKLDKPLYEVLADVDLLACLCLGNLLCHLDGGKFMAERDEDAGKHASDD